MFEKKEEQVALVIGVPFLIFICAFLFWGRGKDRPFDKTFYEEREVILKGRVTAAEEESAKAKKAIDMEVEKAVGAVKKEVAAQNIALAKKEKKLEMVNDALIKERDSLLKSKEDFEKQKSVMERKVRIADKVVQMHNLEVKMRIATSRSELLKLIRERNDLYIEVVKLINQ